MQDIIPDAALPAPAANSDTGPKPKNEAEVILQDSKKSVPVTKQDFDNCMQAWSPQTQMSKSEWAASCRTTLS